MHVGWAHSWLGGTSTNMPSSVREWVAICPRCNVVLRAKQTYYYGNSPTKTRKLAKDALHYHMRVFH